MYIDRLRVYFQLTSTDPPDARTVVFASIVEKMRQASENKRVCNSSPETCLDHSVQWWIHGKERRQWPHGWGPSLHVGIHASSGSCV